MLSTPEMSTLPDRLPLTLQDTDLSRPTDSIYIMVSSISTSDHEHLLMRDIRRQYTQ